MKISSLGLDEIIRNYEREDKRKSTLEAKASYYLVIISVLAGIWVNVMAYIILNFSLNILSLIFYITGFLSIISMLMCGYYVWEVLKIRNYKFPIEDSDPNKLKLQLSESDDILKQELFNSYLVCFSENNIKNNKKSEFLKNSEKSLLFSILFSIISIPIIWVIIWS